MNFSINRKFSKLLSLVLALVMMTTLFAGCKKTEEPEDTSEAGLNLNLSESSAPAETEESTPETTAAVINENTATVIGTLNIRSSPSTEATVVGTLYAGDKIEVSRREVVTGIDWAYIISPQAGWIVMDYVEMDIPTENLVEDTSTPAGNNAADANNDDSSSDSSSTSTNIKGVVNANGLNIRSEASTNGKIQGSYNKGDVVTILETKNGWGRTNKGWIKMEYVTTAGSSTTTNNTTSNTSTNITGNGSTTVILKGIVTASELNVRASASQTAEKVGSLSYGNRVEFYEKDGSWGRTKDGWISLNYVYQDGTTGSKTATGTVTATSLLVRSGPGTGYGSVDSYNAGDTIKILEQFTYSGTTWGCTSKGWVCMTYVDVDGSSNSSNSSTDTKTGTVTATSLLIRSNAGSAFDVVGSLNYGDTVTIYETTTVNGVLWGKISAGYICLDYVDVKE